MEKQVFLKHLGNNVRRLRSEKGWNQSELARRCFKDRQSVEKVENGKTNPSIYYLKEIADALEIPLSELLKFE